MSKNVDQLAIKDFLINNGWEYHPESDRFEKLSDDNKTVFYVEYGDVFNEDWED